jgi:hypothetical protein
MKSQLLIGLAAIAFAGTQSTVLADETVMSTQKSSSPSGETVKVKHDYANQRGTSGKVWKKTEGPHVSKHSATQTSDITHSDGTVSKRRNHESHTTTADGETHKVIKDHKAVSPDGTVTKEHSSDVKTESKGSAPAGNDMNN